MFSFPSLPLPLCPFLPLPHPPLPPPISPASRIRWSFADRFAGTRHFSRWRESECGGGFGRRRSGVGWAHPPGRAAGGGGGGGGPGTLEGSGREQIAPRARLGFGLGVRDAHLAVAEEASLRCESPGRMGARAASPASRKSGHLRGAPAPPAQLRVRASGPSPLGEVLMPAGAEEPAEE